MRSVPLRGKVYIETTIPSYLVARPSRDLLIAAHQQLTRDWWETRRMGFDLFASELVREEAQAGDPALARRRLEVLTGIPLNVVDDVILDLARVLVMEGPMPQKTADALHIASAAVYACDYLLTWNCRYIANAEIQRGARRVVERYGFELPVICTPEELTGDEYERMER